MREDVYEKVQKKNWIQKNGVESTVGGSDAVRNVSPDCLCGHRSDAEF